MASDDDELDGSYTVGRGRPPMHTRFQKGVSGNRSGRPKGSGRRIPYDELLSRKVSVSDTNGTREVTAAEAFLLYLQTQSVAGNFAAQRLLKKVFAANKQLPSSVAQDIPRVVIVPVSANSPHHALKILKMTVKHDAFRPTARMLLEPWLIKAALERLGDRRLTPEDQATVLKATRKPRTITWPDWWEVRP